LIPLGRWGHSQTLFYFFINRDGSLSLYRNGDAKADWLRDASSIFFAPYLQAQVAIVDKWNGFFPEKMFVKYGSPLHGAVRWLGALTLNAKRLDWLNWCGFQPDATIALMT